MNGDDQQETEVGKRIDLFLSDDQEEELMRVQVAQAFMPEEEVVVDQTECGMAGL